jgi:hypothetical protein
MFTGDVQSSIDGTNSIVKYNSAPSSSMNTSIGERVQAPVETHRTRTHTHTHPHPRTRAQGGNGIGRALLHTRGGVGIILNSPCRLKNKFQHHDHKKHGSASHDFCSTGQVRPPGPAYYNCDSIAIHEKRSFHLNSNGKWL